MGKRPWRARNVARQGMVSGGRDAPPVYLFRRRFLLPEFTEMLLPCDLVTKRPVMAERYFFAPLAAHLPAISLLGWITCLLSKSANVRSLP